MVDFACDLIRIPTVNPPGEGYDACARLLGDRLVRGGFAVEYLEAVDGAGGRVSSRGRVNVIGTRRGRADRPCLHLNGHLDVVPAGRGWTTSPFAGAVREGRIYGRGAADMKAGLAAAVYAAEAIRRAGVALAGSLEISGTVDEESGGVAGMGWLVDSGRVGGGRTDFVVIPEPFGPDHICLGHRGVYWMDIRTLGRGAHGSMPFLGVSAVDHLGRVLHAIDTRLRPRLASRITALPVVPEDARHPTINVNAIRGGQYADEVQTPCVADWAEATIDRRFLEEEGSELVRAEMATLLDELAGADREFRYEVADRLVVPPVATPRDAPLVGALERAIAAVRGHAGRLVASPGTYDHKHVARGGVRQCVAYGPGELALAHQPDESCAIDDLVEATKVLALAIAGLVGEGDRDRVLDTIPPDGR